MSSFFISTLESKLNRDPSWLFLEIVPELVSICRCCHRCRRSTIIQSPNSSFSTLSWTFEFSLWFIVDFSSRTSVLPSFKSFSNGIWGQTSFKCQNLPHVKQIDGSDSYSTRWILLANRTFETKVQLNWFVLQTVQTVSLHLYQFACQFWQPFQSYSLSPEGCYVYKKLPTTLECVPMPQRSEGRPQTSKIGSTMVGL